MLRCSAVLAFFISIMFSVGCRSEHDPSPVARSANGNPQPSPSPSPTPSPSPSPTPSPNPTPSPTPTPGPNPKPADGIACYLKQCYPTINAETIEDKTGDYEYPSPEDFPRRELRSQYQIPVRFIDAATVNPRDKLSDNFTAGDFMASQKGRYAIFATEVLLRLEEIRKLVGGPLYVHSGYRSPGYNSRLEGSARFSRHTYGDAIDFHSKDATLQELKEKCLDRGASFYQLYKTHIHCDWRLENLDAAFYDSNKKILPLERDQINQMLAENSTLSVAAKGRNLELVASLPEAEDEGELLYEWTVTTPTGDVITSDQSKLRLPQKSGRYNVRVVIGGSVTIEKTLEW